MLGHTIDGGSMDAQESEKVSHCGRNALELYGKQKWLTRSKKPVNAEFGKFLRVRQQLFGPPDAS